MGIDIYLRWDEMTEAERKAQYTGFSIEHGHVGYLREAYSGAPYATRVLMPEAFDDDAPEDGVRIPAATLRERLPDTLDACRERERLIYKSDDAPTRAFEDFVQLAERLETEGRNPRVIASY